MRALDSLFWRIVLPVPIILMIGIAAVLVVVPWAVERNIELTARENALEFVENFRSIRDYYNEYVIQKVLTDDHLAVGLLHRSQTQTIPAPATFLQEMTNMRGERDLRINQISPFPFRGRQRPPFDDYQTRAWEALNRGTDEVYVSTETLEGREAVRVAVPDRFVSGTCVECHNSHPASPRTDWEIGDVRGLLEVQTFVDAQILRGTYFGWSLVLALTLGSLAMVGINAWNARALSRPLRQVSAALLNLAHGGKHQSLPQNQKTQEVRELVDAFESFHSKDAERVALNDQVHQLAFYDHLTRLPNRTLFCEQMERQIEQAREEPESRLVLLLIDLDHFRDLNNTLGRDFGDRLLSEMGQRLEALRSEDWKVARMGEDEFGVLVRQGPEDESGVALVDRVQALFEAPFRSDGHDLYLSGSIGIAVFPQDGAFVDTLLRNADLALFHAKRSGRGRFRYFSSDLEREVADRVQMTRELRAAVESNELYPHFQPQFDLNSGVLIGAESLLRWRRSDGENVPPDLFIPVAEQSGLIVPIGRKVLRDACEFGVAWGLAGLRPIRIAANVSAIEFREADFVENVERTLKETGLPAHCLELEVTEGAMMTDIDLVIDVLTRLQALGLELAIDDFGTGYSSLSYLKRLPVDRLKIDQAFVRHLTTNEDDANITRTVIALAHNLDLNVLAEGVETAEHAEFLKELGCEEAQGYHFARPMPPSEFLTFALDCQTREPALHRELLQSKRRLKAG